eukprot:CAMPEP_0182520180 /NCGR_PEP_ID=MMETSP1321-20130603/45485_1 /TAXON_ID=91990 /ORGANISM="Bolidomonas sp., Strain RCC1657" /LENGTH=496 /DNA_ID=CAMNT_0024728185 /DNA_START=675 /DNA_END=2165 /DNA_ORIENTATION=-
MDDPAIEPWKLLQIFVQLATTFFASVAFGLRPDKKLLASDADDETLDRYISGTFVSNIFIGMFVWIIVTLWVASILSTGARLHILRAEEDLNGDVEGENDSAMLRLSRWSVAKISFLKRFMTNPPGTLAMSNLYRLCFGVMPFIQFVASTLGPVLDLVSKVTELVDSRSGMFCLLLSEQLLPFAWTGSVLYVFASYTSSTWTRSEKAMLFFPVASNVLNTCYFSFQGRFASAGIWVIVLGANILWTVAIIKSKLKTSNRSSQTKTNHMIHLGAASGSVIPAMLLVGSQNVACLIIDFAAGRPGGYEALQYESNCDSVFNANKGILIIFTYCIFQLACFSVDKTISMEMLVRLQITRIQVFQFISFATTFSIALFLYSCGGGFGEETKPYRKFLQGAFIIIIIFATSIQVVDTLIAKIKLFHNQFGEDLTVGGDDQVIGRDSTTDTDVVHQKVKTSRRISRLFKKKKKKVDRLSSAVKEDDGERIQSAVEMINPGFL